MTAKSLSGSEWIVTVLEPKGGQKRPYKRGHSKRPHGTTENNHPETDPVIVSGAQGYDTPSWCSKP